MCVSECVHACVCVCLVDGIILIVTLPPLGKSVSLSIPSSVELEMSGSSEPSDSQEQAQRYVYIVDGLINVRNFQRYIDCSLADEDFSLKLKAEMYCILLV